MILLYYVILCTILYLIAVALIVSMSMSVIRIEGCAQENSATKIDRGGAFKIFAYFFALFVTFLLPVYNLVQFCVIVFCRKQIIHRTLVLDGAEEVQA